MDTHSRPAPPSTNAARLAPAIRVAPAAALLALTLALAWHERGSIDAADWLPYGVLAGLALSTLLTFGGGACRLAHLPLTALLGLSCLAVWTATTLAWSPVPSLARDEALLTSLYVIALALPLLSLRTRLDRLAALAVLGLGLAFLAVVAGVVLWLGDDAATHFRDGRLFFPVTYVNAQGAIALLAVWPCVVLASGRELPPVLRAAGLGGAAAAGGVWFLTQSAGGIVAFAASAAVVLALAPARLRLLPPLLLAAAGTGAALPALSAPYNAADAELAEAARTAGLAVVLLAAGGAVAGYAYALADRRIAVSRRARRASGVVALAALAAAGLAALVAVGDPVDFAQERWEDFKSDPAVETRDGTHLAAYGSERWDYWRVAADEFRSAPLVGMGARGFGTAYREHGESEENPERSHSLPLDVLHETGLVGLALFLLALVPLAVVAVRLRAEPWGMAALGGGTYWLVHATGDWIWTLPALGLPFFCLLGVAASDHRGAGVRVGPRAGLAAGALVAAVALLAFVPPLLSARYSERALRSGDPAGLDWARRLDPLSVEPYLAERELAATPGEEIRALEDALDLEPRSAALHLQLADAYRRAGQPEAARLALEEARRLYPRGRWSASGEPA